MTSWRSAGGFAALQFSDADHAAMATPGVSIEISPKRSSASAWSLQQASLASSRLIAVGRPVAMVAQGRIHDETVAFVFAGRSDLAASFTMNGEAMDPGSLCVMPERAEIVISTGGHARSIALQVSTSVFRQEARAHFGRDLEYPSAARVLRPGRVRQEGLYRAARGAMRIAERHASQMSEGPLSTRLRRLLLGRLFDCFAFAETDSQVPCQALIRKTADFLHERRGEMVDQWEICHALGVGERVLRRAFAIAYGVSPARFLRLRRLQLARSRLRDGPASSVTEVATDLGFFDLGRFAGEYRELFCELPSTTLNRRLGKAASQPLATSPAVE